MSKKRTSKVWKYPTEKFHELVSNSNTLADIIRSLGMVADGKNYGVLKNRIAEEGIDISHISLGLGTNKGRPSPNHGKALKELLVKGSTYNKGHLKNRLIREGLLEERCYGKNCVVITTWLELSITLQLDHINGDNTDDRLKNLRLLCPNCHSQTNTWGRKKRVMAPSSNGLG